MLDKITISKLGLVFTLFVLASCKKQDDFLNQVPRSNLSNIKSLTDVQNLLQNETIFNRSSSPGMGPASTDDYYIVDGDFNNLDQTTQNVYIWAKKLYADASNQTDWSQPFNQVYYANTAIDAIKQLKYADVEKEKAQQLMGIALFYRSYANYNLMQTFALPYDSANAGQLLGIPLRLDADLNKKVVRASMKECYDQIIQDLETALTLVPATSQFPSQPNKISCNAMLARIYLGMSNYNKAYNYSNITIQSKSTLFDYNNIIPNPAIVGITDPSQQYPFPEVIYQSTIGGGEMTDITRARPDSNLFASYEVNDLRPAAFFNTSFFGYPIFIGTYESNYGYHFDGIATDEIYLIRAECNARAGRKDDALKDLNILLKNRFKNGTFIDRTAVTADDALNKILSERRKELCFRGIRWTDLRRLNKEPRFAITLKRVVNGATYTLPPNDNRYALQIPDNEIQLSGIQQNSR